MEEEDLKRIHLGLTKDRTCVVVVFVGEDTTKSVTVTLSPDNVLAVISKLNTLYKKLVH